MVIRKSPKVSTEELVAVQESTQVLNANNQRNILLLYRIGRRGVWPEVIGVSFTHSYKLDCIRPPKHDLENCNRCKTRPR